MPAPIINKIDNSNRTRKMRIAIAFICILTFLFVPAFSIPLVFDNYFIFLFSIKTLLCWIVGFLIYSFIPHLQSENKFIGSTGVFTLIIVYLIITLIITSPFLYLLSVIN